MRTKALSTFVILWLVLAVPVSAQRPAHDPFALYTAYLNTPTGSTHGKYCITHPTAVGLSGVCIFDDVDSCVKAARDVRWGVVVPNAKCRPNMHYQPTIKE